MMRWTVRLEVGADQGGVKTTELVTIERPMVDGTLEDLGLALSEAKAILAELQASMLHGQVTGYAAHHRVCPGCGVLQSLKDWRTRRLQTLFGAVELEAPRFRVCRCRLPTPAAAVTFSPVCALLTAGVSKTWGRLLAHLWLVGTGSVVFTSFRLAFACSGIVRCVTPAPVVRHQPAPGF
jgi:hypothetical protein